MREREPLKCQAGPGGKGEGCGLPVRVSEIRDGYCFVRPGEWHHITRVYWEGQCECRRVRRNTEWELYKALGWA